MAKQPEFEPQFRIYPRKPAPVVDKYGRMPPTMKRIERMVKRIQSAARATGRKRPRPVIPGRQCFARIHSVLADKGYGVWRQAGKYLAYNKTGQTVPWQPFGPDGPVEDARGVVGQWHQAGDECVHLLVLSPADSSGIDLQLMLRRIMDRFDGEKFITGAKGPIEWVASAHYDTKYAHLHVVIRGVAGGKAFKPSWDFSHGGIQRHAAAAMAEQLERKDQNDKAISRLSGISTERTLG